MVEIKKEPNSGIALERKVEGILYKRFPVKTHIIHIKEDISPIIEEIKKNTESGDFIVFSEKFITISEGRMLHKSLLKPGILAKIVAFVIRKNMGEKAFKNDPGHAVPEKIQACIFVAGWWRIFFALVIGMPLALIWRIFGKKKGWFYIIAGHQISKIDGTFSNEMPPFNEFAKIYPEHPIETCEEIEKKFGVPAVITDSNNINTEILGMSSGVPVSKEVVREILLDNPMGQGREQTPIILVRKS